jgi:hypothetical protein
VDIGTWRSALGDTWPHTGLTVERDWWPQSTHLVWEADPLVVCATGAGGGSQQAMFRRELDPLLRGALARWQEFPGGMSPREDIGQLFTEIEDGFALLDVAYRDQLQASAIGLLVEADRGAIAHVGLERAWRWRSDRLLQLTEDDAIGTGETVQDWVHRMPASWLGHGDRDHRWKVTDIDVRDGDVLVLMAGVRSTGFDLEKHTDALRAKSAQDIAEQLGALAFAGATDDERWHVGSRLAIAVVAAR